MKIISDVASAMLNSLLSNYIFLIIYVVVIIFIKKQFERCMQFYRETSSYPPKTLRQMIEEVILSGLIAGFIASLAFVFTGITVNFETFYYMIIIMVFLILINLRYVCFSYAGGILAFISLVFGKPEVNISSILVLIAVLHLIESVLVLINAGKDNIPIIIKQGDGITGAFMTQHFWPVPIVLLTFIENGQGLNFTGEVTAAWWPLFSSKAFNPAVQVLGLGSLIGILNYSEIAITRHPKEISMKNGKRIFLFSMVLLTIAVLSKNIFYLKIFGIFFAVFAHEGITFYTNHRENKGESLFKPVERGLRILEVLPGSHAEKIGIQRGDIILSINGNDIQTEEGVTEALRNFPSFIWIHAKNSNNKEKNYEYKCYPRGINHLGIVSVPREKEVTYNVNTYQNIGIIQNLVARFRGFNKPYK